jgi:hypothetical protein
VSAASTNLSELLWQILALDPGAGAIEFEGRSASWGELEVRSRELRDRTTQRGGLEPA